MKYFIANWKMNMSEKEVVGWLDNFPGQKDNVIIAASSLHLYLIKERGFVPCAQDVSIFDKGAHTGETGAFQIKEYCKYSLVGHSERKEDKNTVLQKRDACLDNGIVPVVCFINPEEAADYFKPGVILALEDPQNISVDGQYKAKNPTEVRTDIHIIKALLPDEAEVIYGGSVNRQNISELAKIVGLDGVLVGNASLDPHHFYEICEPETSD